MWKFAPALACGNAFILKPSERDPACRCGWPNCSSKQACRLAFSMSSTADKEAVDALLDDHDIKAIGFVGSTAIAEYIYARGCATGKRVQCFGGAKNHMIIMPDADMNQAVDALIGAGYGSAGERCMAISVAVPVGKGTAEELMKKLVPRVETLKIGPSTDSSADYGPLVTQQALERVRSYIDIGIEEGAKLVVDGRGFKLQGYEKGFYLGGCLFDDVTKTCADLQGRKSSARCFPSCARKNTKMPSPSPTTMNMAMASPFSPATATRRATSPRRCRSAWSASTCRSRCRSPIYTFGGWKRSGFGDLNQHGPDAVRLLHQDEDRDGALALGRQGRRQLHHAGDVR